VSVRVGRAGTASASRAAGGPITTPDHALEVIRRAIFSGELRPGQRVAQEELAESIGVSVAPVREALRVLEQEGQLTYLPRRGYFVTELRIDDLEEIYALRRLLEAQAAAAAIPALDESDLERIRRAAEDCASASLAGDVVAELEANRRFHFAILEPADQPHLMRLIGLLWDSTEAYRALYYNSPRERERSVKAHDRILRAIGRRDTARVTAELNAHRDRALAVLRSILPPPASVALRVAD
jgi:DNA-binding GntR family transcriptional regulator